ncbi:uncharacterized protein LOC124648213 [Lolium rigidum]|uniref:uncharacterized protein LOC124648213 n=1 Tax=Lolium rigidum TaxID=89674 RepID=UPI001F5DA5ED|nr:uncharacterized protein LOC124648213 [Lolium rigidum]
MAALRVAARRLVSGGGQTPAVAVGEAQRRIFPRLFQVNRARSTTSSAAAVNSNAAEGKGLIVEDRERRVKLLMDIHRRKEDLYDLTSEAERIYKLPRREAREIARLRQELATQVDCRPNDSTWRLLRGKGIFERYFGFGASMFSIYVLTSMCIGSIVELEPREQRWLKKKRSEASKAKSGDKVSPN